MSDLKTAATFGNVHEAHIACSYLESNGVRALVPDSHTLSNLSYMTPAFGGVRLVVPENQLDLARSLLRKQQNFKLVESDDSGAPPSGEPRFEIVSNDEGKSIFQETNPAGENDSDYVGTDELSRALKCAVFGLILPLVPNVASFYFLGRYLRHKPAGSLSVHFWFTLIINMIAFGIMGLFIYFLRRT